MTGTEVTQPAATLLRCPRCASVLGVMTATELIAGGLRFTEPQRLSCVGCGFRIRWTPPQPIPQTGLDTTPSPVHT